MPDPATAQGEHIFLLWRWAWLAALATGALPMAELRREFARPVSAPPPAPDLPRGLARQVLRFGAIGIVSTVAYLVLYGLLRQGMAAQLANFLAHREVLGWVLFATMLFFSSLAFTVLENAMSVIFFHRVAVRRRHFIVSALMPYCFIVFLALGLLLVTIVSGKLAVLATRDVILFGVPRSLDDLSGYLLYFLGVIGEILILTAIYLVMPVGRLSLRHALIGGASPVILWEITRHALVWYYATISQVRVVYGSFATAITVLLSVEIAAIVLLLGAQVIAEFERRGHNKGHATAPRPMKLGAANASR